MKLPRKLKKGCRTLNGNPRTKWQSKGRIMLTNLYFEISQLAAYYATAVTTPNDLSSKFEPGGFIVSPSENKLNQGNGEIVVNKKEVHYVLGEDILRAIDNFIAKRIRFRKDGKLDIKTDKGTFEGCSLHIDKEPETMWTL